MNWKRALFGTWSWKRPIISLVSIYLALSVIVLFFADRLIFQPPPSSYSLSEVGFKTITTDGGTLASFIIDAEPGQPTLLWSHGNAEDIGQLRSRLQMINKQTGYGILAYDYPGYGASEGSPSESTCHQSIQAAYLYLTEQKKIPADKIILVGQSVGSGPTCWLAGQKQTAGVVLISPFLSAFRTVTRVPLFLGDRFENLIEIKKSSSPLLVIHGDKDKVIPFEHGKKLYQLSPSQEKTFVQIEGAGHNDLFFKDSFKIAQLIGSFSKRSER